MGMSFTEYKASASGVIQKPSACRAGGL